MIPVFLAEMLEKLLESHDSRWVFPAPKGGCLKTSGFHTRTWRPIADGMKERSGPGVRRLLPVLPEVPTFKGKRMYLMRHGGKAWLDEEGHSRFAVETRMGHEVPGAEGVYSNLTVPMERAIMKKMQERWERLHGVPEDAE
ncbi:hypothetical protein [Streptomyces qinglanensis]|uniref:hypothetical protein n=1 Tax=Streptomyces qinglanensis TaxID=943816 RepID=UPI003D75B5A0